MKLANIRFRFGLKRTPRGDACDTTARPRGGKKLRLIGKRQRPQNDRDSPVHDPNPLATILATTAQTYDF